MRNVLFALMGVGLIIPNTSVARSVSYPGGSTVMLSNDGMKNTALVHYSPTAKTSVGYKYEYWRDMDIKFNGLQMNNLLKRWNKKDSQANVYLKSGFGEAESSSNISDIAYFVGVAADWEDRRYFVSYENRYTDFGNKKHFFNQSFRVGWAPYEGAYGDLHTWLMLQVDHAPEAENQLTVTPLVRLFKGVHLFEAGISNRGNVLFNYIYRY